MVKYYMLYYSLILICLGLLTGCGNGNTKGKDTFETHSAETTTVTTTATTTTTTSSITTTTTTAVSTTIQTSESVSIIESIWEEDFVECNIGSFSFKLPKSYEEKRRSEYDNYHSVEYSSHYISDIEIYDNLDGSALDLSNDKIAKNYIKSLKSDFYTEIYNIFDWEIKDNILFYTGTYYARGTNYYDKVLCICSGTHLYRVVCTSNLSFDEAQLVLDNFCKYISVDKPIIDNSPAKATTTEMETTDPIQTEPEIEPSKLNALRSAHNYLKHIAFSYTGLISQLEYEGYSHDDSVYAADNCGADWYEQAAKKAQEYIDHMPFSYDGLVEQLEYEGFTADQARHGAHSVGL